MNKGQAKRFVAVVTGSGGSIGSCIVEALLAKGYFVYGLDIVNYIEDDHFQFLCFDLRNYRELESFIQNYIQLGEYTVVINCAGIREILPINDLSLEQWEQVMSINLHTPFVLSRSLACQIADRSLQGSIVNIASVSGLLGEPDRTAYVCSKHALIGLTKQLAIEFGKYGIRANSISPGIIETNMTRDYFNDPEQMELIRSGNYIQRIGQPEDVANAVIFAINSEAKYLTGSNIVVDGGWTAGKNL